MSTRVRGQAGQRQFLLAGTVLTLIGVGGMQAKADGTVGAEMICPMTGPGAAVCAPAGVILHELVQAANGKRAFGPNGEIMKVLAAPVKIVDGNVKGSERESGVIAKLLRATTGISARDIDAYGIWGGPNSIFRKPFG